MNLFPRLAAAVSLIIFFGNSPVFAASEHEVTSPARVNTRPVADNSDAPFVSINSAELIEEMNVAIDDYQHLQVSLSGMNSIAEVPPGSPPYR